MVRTTWKDYPSTDTPITADALNNIESRIEQALADLSMIENRLDDALTPLTRIRSGWATSGTVPANGYLDVDVAFSSPLADVNYVPLAIISSGSSRSVEKMTCSVIGNYMAATGFRVRISSRDAQAYPVTVYYAALPML